MPGWVIDNAESIREEVEPYRSLSMGERWLATRRCCEAAFKMLRFNRHPERALQHRDALPESTRRALASLRSRERAA
jgi:hypothetical protein